MRRVLLPCLLLAAVLVGALPAGAQAARGACVAGQPGPSCEVWTGLVVSVNDGDTIDVDIAGDGTTLARRVRITGIQTMEQTAYSARRRVGACHAVEATLRLEGLIRRGRGAAVRLSAQSRDSMAGNRLLRTVAVRARGRWRDVGTTMVREGRALWLPWSAESAPNAAYRALTQRAIAARRGLFDPDACGVGPSAASPLALWVNWDADGDDRTNPAGEWVKVRNLDPVNPVALGGWYLRDSGLRRYTFPAAATIAPGAAVTVFVGHAGAGELNWGLDYPVFQNATYDEKRMGDGAYLFDPLGNVRAQMVYPCGDGCTDPAQGAVAVSVDPAVRRESVALTNMTAAPVDLEGYLLKSAPYSYHLGAGAVLPPGATMRVLVGGAREDDTALEKHWGLAWPILRNDGDVVRLGTYADVTVACAAWGDRSC